MKRVKLYPGEKYYYEFRGCTIDNKSCRIRRTLQGTNKYEDLNLPEEQYNNLRKIMKKNMNLFKDIIEKMLKDESNL